MSQWLNGNTWFCIGALLGLAACTCALSFAFRAIGSIHPWQHGILGMAFIVMGILYVSAVVYRPSERRMKAPGRDTWQVTAGAMREGREHIFLDMEGLHGPRHVKGQK